MAMKVIISKGFNLVSVEKEIGEAHGDEDIASGRIVVLLRGLQGRRGHHFLQAQAHVGAADGDCRQVIEPPVRELEGLKLHAEGVRHQFQPKRAVQVEQVGRRHKGITKRCV